MSNELFSLIKEYENKLIESFEKVNDYKDHQPKITSKDKLNLVHYFLTYSFCLISSAMDDIIKSHDELKKIEVGFSINYYPKYKEGPLKGRVELKLSENNLIRTFVFKKSMQSYIEEDLTQKKCIEANFQDKLNAMVNEYLIVDHPYAKLLDIFYKLDEYIEIKKMSKLFSVREYFKHRPGENQIVFAKNNKSLDKFRKSLENGYNYDDYFNYLQLAIDKDKKFEKTHVPKFWKLYDREINDWISASINYYQYCLSANEKFTKETRGNLIIYSSQIIEKDILDDLIFTADYFITKLSELEYRFVSEKQLEDIHEAQLKTAITSILIDSYAHNISAHSLAALKWWMELRYKMMDKRFFIGSNKFANRMSATKISIGNRILKKEKGKRIQINGRLQLDKDDPLMLTTQMYYDALGLNDSNYNAYYYSLYDFLQFSDSNVITSLFQLNKNVKPANTNDINFYPRFSVPIDHALFPFIRFLRDKGAFWSGVIRDVAFGGESKTWYKILWEDFANNPLYLGTIAKSEGIAKINIFLKVRYKGKWIKGRFVTIDMSVIDYEEKLSQNPSEDPKTFLENAVNEDEWKSSNNFLIDYNSYSKYAFIKLGKDFKTFRQILDDERNFNVFLPGGIVGEHALFTIFENTIRNIKHYKDNRSFYSIKNNGIDFWISIENEYLKNSIYSDKEFIGREPELFRVGAWLAHKTLLNKKIAEFVKEGAAGKLDYKNLLFDISRQIKQPILENNVVRMGGNSQDKVCAAMLFNNKFNSVERIERDRDREYFPWIRYATKCDRTEFQLGSSSGVEIRKIESDYNKKYCEKSGYLIKYFHLWHSTEKLTDNTNDWENPSRSKFFFASDQMSRIAARKRGIIRLSNNKTDNINDLYKAWIKEWHKHADISYIDFLNDKKPMAHLYFDNYMLKFSTDEHPKKKYRVALFLSHGSEHSDNCNVRSHGTFLQKYFNDLNGQDYLNFSTYPDQLNNIDDSNKKKKELLLLEFWETVFSRIVIFDDRLFQRIPNSFTEKEEGRDSKQEMLDKQLNLLINPEETKVFESWIKNNKNRAHFLVMHLSFIEKMKDESGLNYTESRIGDFIKDKLKCHYLNKEASIRKDFIFVITSGRGRDLWRQSLARADESFQEFTIFKPVESLLSAIESGIAYNDHFEIKNNLIKVLFGC